MTKQEIYDLAKKEAYEKGKLETIKEIEEKLECIYITFDSERENKQAQLLRDLWDAKFHPAIKSILNQLKDNEVKCIRCNDNGCPACENIKWNIKD